MRELKGRTKFEADMGPYFTYDRARKYDTARETRRRLERAFEEHLRFIIQAEISSEEEEEGGMTAMLRFERDWARAIEMRAYNALNGII